MGWMGGSRGREKHGLPHPHVLAVWHRMARVSFAYGNVCREARGQEKGDNSDSFCVTSSSSLIVHGGSGEHTQLGE